MLRLLRYVVLSFVFMGSSLGAALADTSPPQVHVFSCQVFSGAPFTPLSDAVGLAVRFQNDSPDELASVVWRANYGKYPVDFIDDGSFAPSARIDNYVLFERGTTHFNAGSAIGDLLPLFGRPNPTVGSNSMWSSNMALGPYFGTEDPENCSIVRITTQTGAIWQNPALPQTIDNIPAPTPKPSPTPDAPLAAADPSGASPPIDLSRCILSIYGKSSLSVSYRNLNGRAADSVVFRAPYESSSLDFTDHGSFGQGALISHSLHNAASRRTAVSSLS